MNPELRGIIGDLQNILTSTKAAGCGLLPQWDDLEYLCDFVLKEGPRTILEYGSGYSTAVLWFAIQKLGQGQLYALESDPAMYSIFHAWDIFPWEGKEVSCRGALVFSPIMNDRMDKGVVSDRGGEKSLSSPNCFRLQSLILSLKLVIASYPALRPVIGFPA